ARDDVGRHGREALNAVAAGLVHTDHALHPRKASGQSGHVLTPATASVQQARRFGAERLEPRIDQVPAHDGAGPERRAWQQRCHRRARALIGYPAVMPRSSSIVRTRAWYVWDAPARAPSCARTRTSAGSASARSAWARRSVGLAASRQARSDGKNPAISSVASLSITARHGGSS